MSGAGEGSRAAVGEGQAGRHAGGVLAAVSRSDLTRRAAVERMVADTSCDAPKDGRSQMQKRSPSSSSGTYSSTCPPTPAPWPPMPPGPIPPAPMPAIPPYAAGSTPPAPPAGAPTARWPIIGGATAGCWAPAAIAATAAAAAAAACCANAAAAPSCTDTVDNTSK